MAKILIFREVTREPWGDDQGTLQVFRAAEGALALAFVEFHDELNIAPIAEIEHVRTVTGLQRLAWLASMRATLAVADREAMHLPVEGGQE